MRLSFPIDRRTENEALSRYQAVIDLLKVLPDVIDSDENIYEEKCKRKIGNFRYGINHILKGERVYTRARVDVHNIYLSDPSGSVTIDVDGDETLVQKIEKAWKEAEILPIGKISEIIRSFGEGKLFCYGYCKE